MKKLTRGLAAGVALAAPAILLTSAASATSRPATAAAPVCSTWLETWFAPEGDGFAGGATYVVEFSNINKPTCTVKGFPTIKLTENGKQVGLKATTFGSAATVTLKRGQSAHVALTIRDAGIFCQPVPSDGLSVQAPAKTPARDFPLTAFGACPGKSTMQVDAIRPGVGIPAYTFR